jgi:hypothetical protein
VHGQQSPIATDWPAITNSSVVVPSGSVQVEDGFQIASASGERTVDGRAKALAARRYGLEFGSSPPWITSSASAIRFDSRRDGNDAVGATCSRRQSRQEDSGLHEVVLGDRGERERGEKCQGGDDDDGTHKQGSEQNAMSRNGAAGNGNQPLPH